MRLPHEEIVANTIQNIVAIIMRKEEGGKRGKNASEDKHLLVILYIFLYTHSFVLDILNCSRSGMDLCNETKCYVAALINILPTRQII